MVYCRVCSLISSVFAWCLKLSYLVLSSTATCLHPTFVSDICAGTSYRLVKRQPICMSTPTKTSFEKNCFSAWASTLNMGLIIKVDMVCLSPVGYGV